MPVKTHSFRDRFVYDLHPTQVWLRLAVPNAALSHAILRRLIA